MSMDFCFCDGPVASVYRASTPKAKKPHRCFNHRNIREEALEVAHECAHEAPGLLFGALRREIRIQRARRTQRLAGMI